MTETLYRTALSVGGQGGQELEATQTEQPLSDLDFLRQYRINATIRIIQQVPSKNCG